MMLGVRRGLQESSIGVSRARLPTTLTARNPLYKAAEKVEHDSTVTELCATLSGQKWLFTALPLMYVPLYL